MNMHSYLEIVAEQIRCKRARSAVLEELQGHIEDQKQAYMADGMTGPEAEEEAVRQMGDPVETGTELDRVHRPKMDWLLLGVILLLSAAGLFLQWLTYQQPDSAYKAGEIWRQGRYLALGLVLMLGVCLADYTVIGKHAFRLWLGAVGLNVIGRYLAVSDFGMSYPFRINGVWSAPWLWNSLVLLAFAGVVWQSGRKGKKGLVKSGICLAVSAAGWLFSSGSGFVASIFTLIGVILLIAGTAKGWFGGKVRPLLMRLGTAVAATLLFVCIASWASGALGERDGYRADRTAAWQSFSETSYYQDAREDMKDLAAADRAGEDLTGTQLEWTRFEARSTFLWMYILRYLGAVPAVLLTLPAGLFLAFLFRIVFRQRNRLGFLLALAGTLFFSLQIIWYIGMNIGLFPVTEAYMPFYTLGGSNLCVTGLYAGILLSVYRNSSVVRC